MAPLLHPGLIAVRFRDELPRAGRRRAAAACGLTAERRLELPGESYTVYRVAGQAHPRDHAAAMGALSAHPHVVRAAAVHRHGRLQGIATDRIWLGLRAGGLAVLARLRQAGVRVIERPVEGECLLELPADRDPRVECARLRRRRGVAWAEPDHVLVGRRFAAAGQGKASAVQPALRQIGIERAWRVTSGRRDVVVAVLDDGVLVSHPDLRGAIVARFDATGTGTPTRPRPWDSHGTECAALVAGRGDGATGVRGVAPGCGLAVVRVGFTPSRLADYVTKASWLRRGVDWAWQHGGAAVLSMSFGGGPPMAPVTSALQRARRAGRGGRGCVLVAAAGNDGTAPVEYPGSLAGVIAVAATDGRDRPASFSNRGSRVGLAAPGVNLRTATIPDPAENEPGRYTTDSGTSLATPLVAAAAALVLSAEPRHSAGAVRARLLRAADRPKGLRFVRGRNDRVGAGRLNVARALGAAG